MKSNVIKQSALAIGLFFTVWLILYFLFWQDRTNHGVFAGDALISWIGDVVMLQWVKSYQGLIGGILTLAAGACVLLVALMDRSFRREDSQREREDRTTAMITALYGAWIQANFAATAKLGVNTLRSRILAVEAQCAVIHSVSTKLSIRMTIMATAALASLDQVTEHSSPEENEEALRFARMVIFVATAYLRNPNRLIVDGRFVHSRRTLDDEEAAELRGLGVAQQDKDMSEFLELVAFPD